MITLKHYSPPNGRMTEIEVPGPRPNTPQERWADRFLAEGGWFESETLTTGQLRMTCCEVVDGEEEDTDEVIEGMFGTSKNVAIALEQLIDKMAKRKGYV